jgi:hypothetical protein
MWWWKFSRDLLSAQFEAQSVIALRMMKFAWGGPGVQDEQEKMVEEKVAASADAVMTLATGGTPQDVLDKSRKVMKANAKRLSRP